MDKTETNIKMCEKAEEIQKLWQPSDWDNVWCKREAEVVVLSGYCTDGGYYGHHTPKKQLDYYTGSCDDLSQDNFKDFHIWLPHQDQLQEMIADKYLKLNEMVYFFWSWMERECAIEILGLTSMEQLWLAFVMMEKYGKVWNGEDWIRR